MLPYHIYRCKRDGEYIYRLEDQRTGRILHTMTSKDPLTAPAYLRNWRSKLNTAFSLG